MKATKSLLLVVDANVLHSAGLSEHPTSRCCRDTLEGIKKICHCVVLTPAIKKEWEQHAGRRYALPWWGSMKARKKIKRYPVESKLDKSVLMKLGLSSKEEEDLRKDWPLIYAASYHGNGVIITLDRVIQGIWAKCGSKFSLPKCICWVNPVTVNIDSL